MCGAFAIRLPSPSKIAHEKSSRSLMFTEYAVFCSRSPICSAIDMNRLLKISSRTGSASVPSERRVGSGVVRVSTRLPCAVIRARQPGSTTVVPFCSATIAGPSIVSPASSVSRTYSAASCHWPPEWNRTALWACGAAPSSRGASGAISTGASERPIASTEASSATSGVPGIRNA
ncbi:hypothetical protein BamMEX5DRAFT_6959 [Burkholderia ambifaria MEX-5]|uniref:Uncharacterized protein n=1 Tax=Burkholderia ambifaria MEX-5 TaxID=396597 RepID=B1TGP3_9BURK|nr:hypothetical protein BamMEX5DRAFT_6959 [Burkholderia ambifaria MEX-5]